MEPIEIDPDIRRASTLPAEVYHDPAWFALQRERLFPATWHFACNVPPPGTLQPVTLLPGCLDLPVLVTSEGALSNVCTHRGNLLVCEPTKARSIVCRYHGRRFGPDGRFEFMPEFEKAENFPTAADDLPRIPSATFGPLRFVSAAPAQPFELSALSVPPLEHLVFEGTRDYEVAANWALYCDNYLEGFHIPYVHPCLVGTLDYGAYRTETFEHGVLQVGVAAEGEPTFDGRIGAYYLWLFPATMLNFYPWGLSLNVVEPLAPDRTRVRYLTYLWDESKRARGPGSGLDRVEMEDEAVVESVQRGVRSPFYRRGRYSPTLEIGVHHFHRLLARYLKADLRSPKGRA